MYAVTNTTGTRCQPWSCSKTLAKKNPARARTHANTSLIVYATYVVCSAGTLCAARSPLLVPLTAYRNYAVGRAHGALRARTMFSYCERVGPSDLRKRRSAVLTPRASRQNIVDWQWRARATQQNGLGTKPSK